MLGSVGRIQKLTMTERQTEYFSKNRKEFYLEGPKSHHNGT